MSLSIVRDRPDRRRAYGINAPLHVSVAGGDRVRASEWSHLGFVLPEDALPPIDGGLVQVVLHVDYQGFQIDVPARAALDQTGEDPPGAGLVRLEFVELDGRAREIVQRFVDDYVRGRAVPAGDALVTLDAPHEPIDIEPEPTPPTVRRRLRPLAMTVFYLTVGLATFAYLGVLLYAHLVRLEVRTAVVTRPIEVVRTNDDGTIVSVHREEGELVGPGGLVARMSDPRLDEQIARAEAQLVAAVNQTRRARKRVRIDEQRLRDYRLLWDAERRTIQRDIDRLEKDWRRALVRFHRSVALWDENARGTLSKWWVVRDPLGWSWNEDEWGRACLGRLKPREVAEIAALRAVFPRPLAIDDFRKVEIVSCATLIQRFREVDRLKKRWRAAREDAKRQRRIDRVSDKRLFNGNEFVVDLDVAYLGRDKAKAQESEMRALLASLKAQRGRSSLRSARGGRVVEMAVAPELPVTKGQTVAVVEAEVPPTIDAYLTQEEVGQVGLGDRAEVFLPALDGAFPAYVVRVDRTAGHRDDDLARHFWREDGARSALVRLALEVSADGPHVASGLPATVLFERRSPDLLRRRARREAAARLFPDDGDPVVPLGPTARPIEDGPDGAAPQATDLWRANLPPSDGAIATGDRDFDGGFDAPPPLDPVPDPMPRAVPPYGILPELAPSAGRSDAWLDRYLSRAVPDPSLPVTSLSKPAVPSGTTWTLLSDRDDAPDLPDRALPLVPFAPLAGAADRAEAAGERTPLPRFRPRPLPVPRAGYPPALVP